MTTRRRAAAGSQPIPVTEMQHIPAGLRAGMMLEVWSPIHLNHIETWVAYREAEHDWLVVNGYRLSDPDSWPAILSGDERFPAYRPFSLAEWRRDDPDRAAAYLLCRGLPVDFEP